MCLKDRLTSLSTKVKKMRERERENDQWREKENAINDYVFS